jgi:hypothetical protein
MYGKGGGDLIVGIPSTAAGIAILPNTGGSTLLLFVSLLSTVIGTLIIASTLIRFIAKRAYKA